MKKTITILLLVLWAICSNAQIQNSTICQGDSLLFYGKYYSTAGAYPHSVQVIDHIDTIFVEPDTFFLDTFYRDSVISMLVLNIAPKYVINQQVNLCNGETYYHNGVRYSSNALVSDTFHSRFGCDSIVRLSINFHPVSFKQTSASICEGDYYKFGNRKLTQTGIYHDSLKTTYGCDSVIELTLTVNHTFYEELYDTICKGMTYTWYGKSYNNPGSYKLSDKTKMGCDSVHVLNLAVRNNILRETFDTVCQGDSCLFRGKYYKNKGTYYDTVRDPGSCDTIFSLRLHVNKHENISKNVTICENDVFLWAGHTYTDPGVYYDTLPGRNGQCDTFSVITLNTLPVPVTTVTKGICKESSFTYRGKVIDKPGLYLDTFIAVNGCDSIVRLIVNENPSYVTEDTAYICEGDTNYFFDQILTNTGVYTAYLESKDSCDSIFIRNLIVFKNDTTNLDIRRCDHQPYNFFGVPIYQPGSYTHTLTNRVGCDSIIILNFDTIPYFYVEYAHICEGEVYNFHGKNVSVQGTHYAQYKSKYECDSTYKLYLTVGKRYEFVIDTSICQGSPFFWRGKQYVTSGTFMDSSASSLGCDSVFVLNLNILTPKHFTKVVEFCQGDSLSFNGRIINRSVNIDDTLRAFSGCDSIVHYRFNMLPSFHHSDTIDLCIGSSYHWHGQNINQSGIYWDSLKTVNGCDSVFKLTVRGVHSQLTPLSATICNGEYYDFNGKRLFSTGTYYDTIYNSQGCADIYVLSLTVNQTYTVTEHITLCSDQGFWYSGIYIDKPGVFYDSLVSSCGCDSIHRIVVNRAASYFYSDTARIYQGATYNFHGRMLRIGGTYYDSLKTVNGCDSIYQLILYVTPQFHSIEYASICDNDVYNFRGRNLTTAGVYFDSLKTFNNFDSIYELRLSVNPTYTFNIENTECYGNSIYFRGIHITKPGVYYDSLYTVNGCDSIYRLVFNWSSTYLFEDTAVICKGDHYHFRGRNLAHAGIYYDSLKTQQGCDSIYKLTLIVKNHFYSELTDTLCDGDVYDFHGRKLVSPGIYYDSISTQQGCDSIYKLTLYKYPSYEFTTVIEQCYGEKWQYRGLTIDKPGVYYDSLKTKDGCDSVYKLVYTWLASYHFYDTVNICIGDHYNFRGRDIYKAGTYYDSLLTHRGCDSIYQLYLNVVKVFHDVQTVHICSNEYYNFRGTVLNQSGVYWDSLKSSYGCDSIYELRLTILPHYLINEYIEFCQGDAYQYKGITITKPGTYYDSLLTQQGCDSVVQIIVNYAPRYLFVDTAVICAGSAFHWRGRDLTVAGQYYDSLLTRSNCDSIYKLVLSVVQPFYQIDYVEICSNEYYNFHGRYINQSGTYFDSLKNHQGCDSIYELHLNIKPHYIFNDFIDECYGNSVIFRGKQITKPGIYYDSLLTHDGCDSIYRLVFNWKSNYLFHDTATICSGGSYNFRGKTITNPGYYYDSLTTVAGCDSVYQLLLTVNPIYQVTVDTTICGNETFDIRGVRITQSGTYIDSLKAITGCDSIITYNLTILPSYLFETNNTLCHGEEIFIRGRHITKPGTYIDSMKTVNGCDSIFKMVFNWTPTYLFTDTVVLCDGSSYVFHGRNITNPGIYYDSLTTVAGCDSVYKLMVFTGTSYYKEVNVRICSDSSYYLRGKLITESGIYWDSLKTVTGCDSVIKYHITVNRVKFTAIHVDICSNEFYYRANGTPVNVANVYYDTLYTTEGCDSIIQIALNVYPAPFIEESRTICKGNYIIWHGRKLSSAGVYWDSLVTVHGCDSIYKLTLTNHSYYNEIDTTICNNSIFTFNNKVYTSSGIYYDTLKTVNNCDSVFKIDLKINPNYNIVQHITMCDTDFPIPFAGGFVNQTGVYHDTTTTLLGCDSINTLYLTVVPTYTLTEDTICEDEIYSWRGHQYTQPGLYADTVHGQTEALCDIIFALRLHTVQKTNLYGSDIAPFICADDLEYSIAPRYTGTKPDAYTVRYTSANIAKSSDILNANFTTNPILIPLPLSTTGDSLRPDTYTGTLELYNRMCDANPMSIDFTLNIRYPSYIVEQHWNDVVAILNGNYNGGYTFSKYEWFVNDILIQSITGSNMFLPNLRTGDKVEVALTREGEGYSVLTCPIWMQDLRNMEVSEYPVSVEGTILRNNSHARIIASAAGTYSLFTATGALVSSGSFSANTETQVALPPVSGIYFLKVVSNDEPRIFKLLVQ